MWWCFGKKDGIDTVIDDETENIVQVFLMSVAVCCSKVGSFNHDLLARASCCTQLACLAPTKKEVRFSNCCHASKQ
jgi:hypothetical protein